LATCTIAVEDLPQDAGSPDSSISLPDAENPRPDAAGPPDAQPQGKDAATVAEDVGAIQLDAGVAPDASLPGPDASTPPDAGAPPDAGTVDGGSGTTSYVSLQGSDSNSCAAAKSPGTAKATFSAAWQCLNAGDTLIIADGTYQQNLSPPTLKSGTSAAPITARAEHDGLAMVDGEGVRETLVLRGSAYLVFEGLTLGNGASGSLSIGSSTGKTGGVSAHHNEFRRMGVFGWKGLSGNLVTVGIGGGAHHNLLEDMWVWGRGRYSVMIYGGAGGGDVLDAPFNTVRRVVVRHDPYPGDSGDPQAGLAVYSANHNTIENVIIFDSIEDGPSDNSVFYLTGHAPDTVNGNSVLGCIALASTGGALVMDADTSRSNRFENTVSWGNTGGGMSLIKDAQSNTYDAMTLDNQKSLDGTGFYNAGASTTLRNSLVMHASAYGVKNVGSLTATSNYFYGNQSSDCEGCTLDASNDLTHRDPGLRFILRQEATSPLKGTGAGGADRGATVLYRYQNGTISTEKLWPWPNESRLRLEMCDPSALADFGRTGPNASPFCASGKSLTRYIWEAAGNPMPSSLYP
jgi:hypothetical protein